jgi:hypothetical protein
MLSLKVLRVQDKQSWSRRLLIYLDPISSASGKLGIQLNPERYEIVRKDRTCKKGHEGGGVINAVRRYDGFDTIT